LKYALKTFLLFILVMIQPHNSEADETPRVLFFGDSLTAGYGIDQAKAYPQLVKELAAKEGIKLEVINGGMSGDTSTGGVRRLPWFLRDRVDICLVALGANDGLRGLPVPALKENLKKIIDTLRAKNP